MKRVVAVILLGLLVFSGSTFAERINQEGRILGALPVVTNAILFNTNNADAVVSAMQIFPVTNPWNEDISDRPVHPDSAAIIAGIGADKPLGYNLDMNFVLVPADQPRVPVRVTLYPAESDPGPFPIPSNAMALRLSGPRGARCQRNSNGDVVAEPIKEGPL